MSEMIDLTPTFKNPHINTKQYEDLYQTSINDPDKFWDEQGQRLDWFQKWSKVSDCSFESPVSIKWYLDGKLNVSHNCIDRHLKDKGDQTAIIWEPDNPNEPHQNITYKELHKKVCQWSELLTRQGVKKGDRVTVYLPMVPEAAYALLACTRIGAIHSVVFAGFSADALKDRIQDCDSEFVITADVGKRGGKVVPLKVNVDKALESVSVKKVFVVKNGNDETFMKDGRDIWTGEHLDESVTEFEPSQQDSEDPLFILYTSGSTNKPKGVLHTTGGYLVYASLTHELVFNYRPGDIYWCAADIGWITGHSYMIYGPLANGATTVLFEGVPNYPTASRLWEVVDKHQINILYTAPTAIRALRKEGTSFVEKTNRSSLKVLGSVGEPINPEAWHWYFENGGKKNCPIVDTWWQTETGGILISPLPGATPLKPGSATHPLLGIEPLVVDNQSQPQTGEAEGQLCIKRSWPGQMRTVYKNHARFEETYFSQHKGYYFSGDGCKRDSDGYFWITGRVDDVLNVSGHRLGTAEIESSFVGHSNVAEAGVVGVPHEIKGEGIVCFIQLKDSSCDLDAERKDLVAKIRTDIGPIASPDKVIFVPGLPKTRSGKIMRRLLRKIASNESDSLGDISTLADTQVVEKIITAFNESP